MQVRPIAQSVLCAGILTLGCAATATPQTAAPPAQPAQPAPPAQPKAPAKPKTPAQPGKDGAAAKDAKPAKEVKPAGYWYGVKDAPAKKPGAIRIGAYNVENLFDAKDDPTLQGQYDDAKMVTKPTRVKAIADAIRRLDADVLSIEEIESLEALTWLRDTYLKDLGYKYIYSEDVGYYRGVEQAFLSRYPIVEHKTFVKEDLSDMDGKRMGEGFAKGKPDQGKTFQRSPLCITVDVNGTPVTLFSVHLKAGGKEFEYQRESEALQVIEFVKEALTKDPGARVAVMGDFNSTPGTKVAKVFGEAGLKSGYEFRAVKKGNTKDLYTTHDSGRAIDYIFMSPEMAKDAVDGTFFVLSTVHPPSDYKWQDDENKDKVPPGYASDHYPIALDFTLPAKSAKGAAAAAPAKPAGK